jgi:hypothetical protein
MPAAKTQQKYDYIPASCYLFGFTAMKPFEYAFQPE